MQLVKPSIEHVDVTTDPLKAIELAGRTCYKSEDKITEDSAEKFVQMLLKRTHHAMIEHGNFIMSVDDVLYDNVLSIEDRQYIRMSRKDGRCLISGNPRALMDFCREPYGANVGIQRAIAQHLVMLMPVIFQPMLDEHLDITDEWDAWDVRRAIISDLSISEKLKHQVASYRIVCNRGFTHELVRHRPFSYAQESTRYCNYKGGVSFIIPPWVDLKTGEYSIDDIAVMTEALHTPSTDWAHAMGYAELIYKNLTDAEWVAQKARGVLPIDLKTEIVVTGNLQQWVTFFGLRCAKTAHPQMQEIANMILADMKNRVPVIFDEVGK